MQVLDLSRSLHYRRVDEHLWRQLFQRMWDDPVWPVESYRELFMDRYYALENFDHYTRERTPAGGCNEFDIRCSAGILEQLAGCCTVLAAAINASRHLNRTKETIRVNDMLEKSYEMFWKIDHYTESNLRHRELRRFTDRPWMKDQPDLDLDKSYRTK